ncbi:MAG: zinc ribbon domain-containing protein [Chloroflexi bacterium]|nr:zinc ribbon domain-containing protein [Chloroflexota bacterium]MCY4247336.1 zinc ribbon domain-containing protein [Chloroflexota bacterium]
MPIYTYRREDGTTFDIRQRFGDSPLQTCPDTRQAVQRVIQPAGIIFKGSGFYVNDNNKAKNPAKPAANGNGKSADKDAKTATKAESKQASQSPSQDKAPAAAK